MRAWLSFLVLTGVLFAGCASDDANDPDVGPATTLPDHGPGYNYTGFDAHGLPMPVLFCVQDYAISATAPEAAGAAKWTDFEMLEAQRCNLEMTPDEGREGNEVTIAVNPLDPRNIVGGAKDYYPADAGECVWDGVYVTHDGGRTPFEDRSFDGSPWRLRNGDIANYSPNYASQMWCTTDPVAYFNTAGELYYLLMAYQADPVTGSKACEAECPQGALNDWAFNRAVQIIAVSSDGGDSFHTFTPVLEGTFPVNFHDKGWIAASHDGTIHVMWLAFFVPGNQYCRSTDGGQTYLCTEIIAPQFLGAGQGSFLEVGTGGQVYAAWYSGGIQIKRSQDYGGTWDEPRKVVDTNPQSMPGLSGRDRRTGYPAMATDRSTESPFSDAIYFTWNDACNDDVWKPRAQCENLGANAVWVAASHDGGDTFEAPVRVSHNGTSDWSIFPAISVSPGGVIDVSWMETRGARNITCPANPGLGEASCSGEYPTFEQFYAYSLDGGKTFSEPVNIRDANDGGWDPAKCHHQNGNIFIGDYNDIDSSWQAAHPVWPDARDGHCDVYTATVQRPMFAQGWSDEARQAAETVIRAQPL